MAVRCPNCGNPIDERSRFCNSCGHRLDHTPQGLCPECGAENPPSNIFCDKCGTRLFSGIPSSDAADEGAVRGLSLPSKEPVEDDDAPDWLAQLRSGFGDQADQAPELFDDQETESSFTEEKDDPFSGYDDSLPSEAEDKASDLGQEDEIPDWLRDALSGAEPSLTELGTPSITPATAQDDVPEGLEAGELPDWLTEMAPSPPAPEQVPDAVEPDLDLPSMVPPVSESEADELPDWLRGMTETDQAETSPAQEPDIVPDWLQEAAAAETVLEEGDTEAEPGELMDWLQGIESSETVLDEEMVEGELPLSGEEPVEASELMDWLRDVGTAETAAEDGVPEPEQIVAKVDEIPDWLQEAAAAKTVQEEVKGSGLEPADMPDWLQQLRPQEELPEEEAPEPEREEPEPGQVPEWLQEIGETGMLPEAPAEDGAPSDVEPVLQTGDLPDWLQAIGPPEEPEPIKPDLDKIIAEEPVELLEEPKPETVDTGELGPLPEKKAAEVGAVADLPDWLEAMDPSAAKGQVPADAEDEGLPDWLQDFALEDEADTPGLAPPAPLIPEKKAPEPQAGKKSRPRPAAPSPAEASALTDWLGETAPMASGGSLDPTRALGGTGPLVPPELPEWLAAVGDSSSSDMPDWLEQEEDASTLLAPDRGTPKEEPATGALPSWLTEGDDGLAPRSDEGAPAEAGLEQGELPDWLQLAPVGTGKTGLDAEDIPEYVVPSGGQDVADAALAMDGPPFSVRDIAMDSGLADQLGLVQAEIPDWLQALKPAETPEVPVPEIVESLEPVETGGFLDGLRGALTSRAEVSAVPVDHTPSGFAPTKEQQAHAQVLEQIILAGPAPMPDITRERRAQAWMERLVIPLLILAAVLFPLAASLFPELGGNPLQSYLGERVGSQKVVDTFDLIDGSTSESSLVIVAFDYSPAKAGELDPIATTMLRHLAGQGARILAVSTTPTGSELAHGVMEQVVSDQDAQYGDNYLNLGYIPGGATGLRAFATDPWGMFSGSDYLGRVNPASSAPAAAGLGPSLASTELLLILTGERDDLLGWIEQVGRPEDTEAIKMVAGVSASLEPWAQPYYASASGQLEGLVGGVPDAAQYEGLVNQDSGTEGSDDATTLQDGQVLGLGVIILIIAAGLIVGTGQGLVNRRRADG